jgi:hypothetical protein
MRMTASAVYSVIMRLSAGSRAVILVVVSLCMTGIAKVVLCLHVSRFIAVACKTVLTCVCLKCNVITSDCALDECEIVIQTEVHLRLHRVMAFNAFQRRQLVCVWIYIIVAVMFNDFLV